MKKQLLLLISMLLPLVAMADDSGSCGTNVTYTYESSTGTLTIQGSGAMSDYSYSSDVPWHSYRTDIKTVVIIKGVTSIGNDAFYGCSGLTSIEIPNSVTSIGNYAFSGCSGLTSIEIPNSVTRIDFSAFSGCSSLISIIIPNRVKSIENYVFSGCSGLTSITIPSSVTSIGEYAFKNCNGLTSVKVLVTNYYNFCNNMVVRLIASNISKPVNLIDKEGNEIKKYVIPDGVTSIGEYAFYGCSGLTSVKIPNSVTSIGGSAFRNCESLTTVSIPASVTSIGNYAFSGCSGLISINVNNENTKYDSRNNCNAIIETSSNTLIVGCKNSVIPNSVTSIGYGAFYGCNGLASIEIPNSVTSIGSSAFSQCAGLSSVTIPNNVTSIGSSAFYNCSGLTSVTIGNSVTSIGYYAFEYCSGLTSIVIPNSVTSIDYSAFQGCSSLISIIIGNSITYIGAYAFQDCQKINDVYCYTVRYPSTNKTAFSNSYPDYITLHVPAESVDPYKEVSPWNTFRNVVALTDSDPKPTDTAEHGDPIIGDIDGDGVVDVNDVQRLINIILKK